MESPGTASEHLRLNTDVVRRLLTGFLRDGTTNAGFSKAVLGLSGGIDSAAVAFLAAEAMGPENVLAVLLPYKTSNPKSASDAMLVVKQLGIRHETVDITPMVEPLFDASMDPLRKGNIMARERMIVLYDRSARESALVFGTSNKTEILLGYGTQFGDTACALNPLGDLYKTQVWQLGEALGVPRAIVEKKPSADLWEGQTDEQELGFSYHTADRLLYAMIDEQRTDEDLASRGFEPHLIEKVRRMVRRNQYKRVPPVIAKLSHRTVNVDFRYPRDWGM
jgi:NAD+ synthase